LNCVDSSDLTSPAFSALAEASSVPSLDARSAGGLSRLERRFEAPLDNEARVTRLARPFAGEDALFVTLQMALWAPLPRDTDCDPTAPRVGRAAAGTQAVRATTGATVEVADIIVIRALVRALARLPMVSAEPELSGRLPKPNRDDVGAISHEAPARNLSRRDRASFQKTEKDRVTVWIELVSLFGKFESEALNEN
jgi:hypothetical protein